MVVNFLPQNSLGTSLVSLTKGFVLTQRTDCKSPRTIEYYEGSLKRFLWFVEQQKWPDDARLITQWSVREFLAYVSGETNRWGLHGNGSETSRHTATYSTVHHYYCVLKAFFNWCVREDYLTQSPLDKIKLANPKLNVIQPYTDTEIGKMLATCELDFRNNAKFVGSRNKAIILMLFDSGLRVSELASIKLEDVDSERGWIKVKGKGAKERVVRIGSTTQKALWRYEVYRFKNNYNALWLTEEGRPFSVGGIQIMVKRLKTRAGVTSGGNCHKFRHTFALAFLRKDRNPFNLQYLLGHSDLRMTRHYVSTLGAEDALKAHESASPADMLGFC
jgi:site-specific recombinase XerD